MAAVLGSEAPIVVLASQSPNRLRLLQQLGASPIVKVSDFEENLSKDLPVTEFVVGTALGKLKTIVDQMRKNKEPYDVIIACDTVIHFENEIIGKPADSQDAIATLKRMRGKEHDVYTGVAIAYGDGTQETFSEKTIVRFANFSDKVIGEYVATGEPLKKAGSYSIMQLGAVLVEGITGCFSNVVGLPIQRVFSALTAKGIHLLSS